MYASRLMACDRGHCLPEGWLFFVGSAQPNRLSCCRLASASSHYSTNATNPSLSRTSAGEVNHDR